VGSSRVVGSSRLVLDKGSSRDVLHAGPIRLFVSGNDREQAVSLHEKWRAGLRQLLTEAPLQEDKRARNNI